MCGICGWIELSTSGDLHRTRPNLVAMSDTIQHRGPDHWGSAEFKDAAIAMTRLSIIDLEGGHQPIFNDDKSCSIVFNGEIYNFKEVRRELEGKGARFRTRSDTEVVLRAYEQWGDDCLHRLRGMFALAIYDSRPGKNEAAEVTRRRPRLLLARDRVGKKPLYYYKDQRRMIFGSEIKAILANTSLKAQVRRSMLPLYLSYGYVPAPYTFFENIFELPPAHRLIVENGEVNVERYWEPPPQTVADRARSEKQHREELRERFEEAVRIRLVSDVPLGAFLSGGVDSAAVVAFMTRITKQPVQTFSIGFTDDPSFNELEHARTVANYFKSDHREFMVSPDTIDLLPKLVWHYDQPFADSSAIPSFLVARMTREHVKVALTGDGSDELFAGYERFAAAQLAETYRKTPHLLQIAVKQFFDLMPEATTYRGFVRRARRFVDNAALPLPERYLGWVGIFPSYIIGDLLINETETDPVSHFQSQFTATDNGDLVAQLLAVNMKTYLPGDLLVKTDRMAMANSLEARCPFLDQEFVEFTATIPSELKLKGMTRNTS